MRSANLFGPLKGLCPHKALIGLTQASGLAGGFDSKIRNVPFPRPCEATGNDARKLHALAFVHVRGALLLHEALYRKLLAGRVVQ